ncbi:replication protein A 70 kDa DNA-binding subunit C-like [Bidens hawaiensis]|uniref:replication protein A 70 kDa DNA-binding subunit C-like n=1 Tax=Bidens hawaiensis TaxID=980011 RepID=UPI00404962E0
MVINRSVGDKKIIMLNQLPSSKDCMEDSIIRVPVIRLWENHILDKPEQLISIDRGNMVHGSVLKRFIYKFERYLSENACYIIKNVSVGDYSTKYKYVDNDKKVNLFLKSTVTPCEDFGGDLHGFKFQSIDALIDMVTKPNTIVAKYQPIEDKVKSNGVETKMMYLTLKGLRNNKELPLTLWGSYAVDMSNYILSNSDQAPVVVVLQFGLFRIREGRPPVFNSLNVSKMYINKEIPEINEFKIRYLGSLPSEPSSSSRLSAPTIRVPFREEFLNSTEFCQIIELEEFYKPKQVIICGKILPMSYMQWYYVSCKVCTKLVKYKVNKEGEIEGSPILNQFRGKYRINLAVQDVTGVVDLSLWEGHATKLLKISAYDLLLKVINGRPDSDLFPEELKNLENKLFAFKISVNQFNLDNQGSQINISKITEDAFILAELQKKVNSNQVLTISLVQQNLSCVLVNNY